MVKRIKKRPSKASKKKIDKRLFWITSIVLGAIAVLAFIISMTPKHGEEKGRSFHLVEKETRTVLDPSKFIGRAQAAYAAAENYPEIMNEVFCYCYCNEPPFHHKTLLSCFVEKHGAG
jgi:hypothetical protein